MECKQGRSLPDQTAPKVWFGGKIGEEAGLGGGEGSHCGISQACCHHYNRVAVLKLCQLF